MKRVLSSLVFLLLAGCAHYHIVGFDNQTGMVTVARNKHGDQEGLNTQAAQHCAPRQAQLLGCGEGTRSEVATVGFYGGYGGYGSGGSHSVTNKDDAFRCTYQCQ
jgi:hypothetical protein